MGAGGAADDLDRVAETMADLLVAALSEPRRCDVQRHYLTDPIDALGDVDGAMFSGGVAEYVYGRESRDFGDLGRRLGTAVRSRIERGAFGFDLLSAGECIRATVLGASEYSVQLSGNTTYITDPDALLPRRNVQVVRPDYVPGDDIDPHVLASAIRARFAHFGADDSPDVALALSWSGAPSHTRLLAFAEGIRTGLAQRLSDGRPVYLVLDGDVGLSLGSVLRDELGLAVDLLVIDGLRLWDFDYVDLGRVRLPSNTVPVTIKSLVFGGQSPRL
jgi:ethanolamine utilization protein EutA